MPQYTEDDDTPEAAAADAAYVRFRDQVRAMTQAQKVAWAQNAAANPSIIDRNRSKQELYNEAIAYLNNVQNGGKKKKKSTKKTAGRRRRRGRKAGTRKC
uniref:Uncharacterized protein n=1 Tax=viral metagenome TaxID=1070528 RepID=A0A6C0I6L3_9ZZZZ